MKFSFAFLSAATITWTQAALVDDCQDPIFFIQNYEDCAAAKNQAESAVEPVVETVSVEEAEFVVGMEESEPMKARAADLSGCGVHRTCTACRDTTYNACYWNPGTGCVKRFNNAPNVCTAANNVAPQCSAFESCYDCTIQNGCIFYRGRCTYSRGSGCESDPANCINYSWNCPANPPLQVLVPQAPLYSPLTSAPKPVMVQTPDRVEQTVRRVEDMIIGMSATELRRLRTELDAVLIAAEMAAVPAPFSYNTPVVPVYQPAQAPQPTYTPASTMYGIPSVSSFPATFTFEPQQSYAPAYTTPSYFPAETSTISSFANSQFSPSQDYSSTWSANKPSFTYEYYYP